MTILTTIAFITSVLLSANTALAASVANPHFTPMSLSPEPASVNLSYEVAGVYWLPDYLKGNISRGSEDPGGGDIDTGCGIYGLFDNCEPPRQAGGVVYPVSGLKCFKGCSCPPAYQYNVSNRNGNYEVSGACCGDFCTECRCKTEFAFDSGNCVVPAKMSGESCGGKYESCVCPEGFSTEVRSCGSNQDKEQSGSVGGLGCFRCNCDERFSLTSCPANAECEQCGDKYSKLGCKEGYYEEEGKCEKIIPCPQGTSLSDSCDEEHKAVDSGSLSGGAICYRCEEKTCEERGMKDCEGACIALTECCNCSDEQKCFDGACVPKTCEDKGMKECNGACIALTECCNCGAEQKCVNGVCVDKTCEDKGLKTCNGVCIAIGECCGGCSDGAVCINGSCVCRNECTLSSCPAGTVCRQEACSGKFCGIGCEVGYVTPYNYLYLFYLL